MPHVNSASALWFTAPHKAVIREEPIGAGAVSIRMLWSAISRGTERLVFAGRVPESEYDRMRAPFQSGDFPFPVKYGYCAVGEVTEGPDALIGRTVFALHPHQTLFSLPQTAVAPLPTALPPRRAVLAANMETAINGIWDSGAAPGDRIVVVGAGAVGLLIAALLSRMPGCAVTLVDIVAERAGIAAALDVPLVAPDEAPGDADIAFHTAASAEGLATALGCLGPEGRAVEMSWHGAGVTAVPLGGAFHARRLHLISSQVGQLPPARRPRWSHARRLALALDLLAGDDRLDALITGEVAFADLPARLPELLAPGAPGVTTAVRYG